jgi:outer membrane biosynthesis protein TonB
MFSGERRMSKKKTPRTYSSKLDPVPEESAAAIKEVPVEEETKQEQEQEEVTEAKAEEEKPAKKKAGKKPAKAKKKKPAKKDKPPKKKQNIQIGDYTISVREGSAYASLYSLVAELGGFKTIDDRLEALDTTDEAACKSVLKTMRVNREIL